jgi:hypothetical protein
MGLFKKKNEGDTGWAPLKDLSTFITGTVGGLTSAASSALVPVLNTGAASVAAGALVGSLTGSTTGLGGISQPALQGAMGGTSGAKGNLSSGGTIQLKEATFLNKLINIYKLKDINTLKSTDGKEYLNYDLDSTGAKQINTKKVIILTIGIVVVVVLVHDVAVQKNKRWFFMKK